MALSGGSVLGASTSVVVAGVASEKILPNTGDNTVGQVLAYTAIFVGIAAVFSRLLVILVKRSTRQ